jgi:hypothetical protein
MGASGIEILWLHGVWSHGDFKPDFNRWFLNGRLSFDATLIGDKDIVMHCSTITNYFPPGDFNPGSNFTVFEITVTSNQFLTVGF